MLPLGCVAAPKMLATMPIFVSAPHSSGSKLPRHRYGVVYQVKNTILCLPRFHPGDTCARPHRPRGLPAVARCRPGYSHLQAYR
ncbi:hypothetical protein C9422_16785 [Pseudomonas sp. B1(2018)]|nr:hypothetical protein C9422_16785 [Pseudomonas sp. B1(2018)]